MRQGSFSVLRLFVKTIGTIVFCLMVHTVKGQTGTLPVIHIETQDHKAITSKTVYIPGTYYIVDSLDSSNNKGSAESPLTLEIRGRGNSSWRGVKKPYKIKLTEKVSLLGMKRNKHWALLKFYEPTVFGMQLGKVIGMDWTPSTQPVEVVLNGTNLGLYLLTETNRIGINRLDIYEQPDFNEDESTIPYGWLVEVDNYYDNNQISIKENNKWKLNITYHSPDSLSPAQKEWLTREFTEINSRIYDEYKDFSTWEELLDVDAMAKYFIVQEVMDNSDGFHGSFFLHKDSADDARWMAGPLWDLACGQRKKTDYTFRMKTSYGFTPHWIGELIKDRDFCEAVSNVWTDFYPDGIEAWLDEVHAFLEPCSEAFEVEKTIWNYSNKDALGTRVQKLKSCLLDNAEWFHQHLPAGEATVVNVKDLSGRKVVRTEYINIAGVRSAKPWNGVNIKETIFDDGSRVTTKVVMKN